MSKDLNLLRVFVLLLDECNLSRAALRLHLTQPALSRSLARLRREFNDPLFVRAPGGMLPTPKAVALEPSLREVLEKVDRLYEKPPVFDPAKAKGIVRIATTDYFEQVIWVELAGALSRKAPGLTFVTLMTGSQIPVQEMRDGTVQLAIAGFFGDLPPGFMRQAIFSDKFFSVVRADHPGVKGDMTLEAYLDLGHLIVSPRGALEGAVDAALKKKSKRRRVVASVCSFLSSGPLVSTSDLVLTAPAKLVEKFASYLPLSIHEPPLALPKINVVQVWHERFHHDPMLAWLRNAIADACKSLS
jgi:DNA-binding transcriptional LysR family regulator